MESFFASNLATWWGLCSETFAMTGSRAFPRLWSTLLVSTLPDTEFDESDRSVRYALVLEKWYTAFSTVVLNDNQELHLNPIHRQALGYAEWVRGEQIHPRTLAVNTACILQWIQFFCPLNKYFILSWYFKSIIFAITCFTSKQQILKVLHMDLLFLSSPPLLCLHSPASLLEKWSGNLKILLSVLAWV